MNDRDALQLTQFAIDHVGVAAYWTKSDGRLFYVNQTASIQSEYSREELLKMTVPDLDPDFPKEVWAQHWQDVRQRKSFVLETTHRSKSGRIYPVEVTVNHVIFDGQEYNCTFVSDITQRKNLERTARQAEKMSAVGLLAAGVAHEINNPLGVILGFAQGLLSHFTPTDRFFAPIQSIEREALRCKNLVQNLLTFSRGTKKGRALEDPLLILANALVLVETQAKVRCLSVEREVPDHLPQIIMNGSQIQQVIINLCTNAIDAMPDPGGLLKVGMAVKENQLMIWIADTGTGISDDVRPKIFEPFFTTKGINKGTGLGLSLVYEIVTEHRGTIDVQSELHKGTCFTITLPMNAAAA